MGLLDDAIREHLELKRRHGADPSEVERQEHEALGPARRGAAPAEDAQPLDPDAGGAVAMDRYDDDRATAVFDAAAEAHDADEPGSPDAPEPSVPAGEPEAPVTPAAPADDPDQGLDDEPEAGAVRTPDAVERPREPVDGEADAESGPQADGASDDVLEETPDFLQETPEHDRLWFEQKPPRDFDF